MPRWTAEQLREYEARNLSKTAQPERPICHEPVAKKKREAENSGRIRIRITSYRCRLIDPDNLCEKYAVDCLRYAGLIQDDRHQDIEIQKFQEKVKTRKEERTEIEIS